MDIAAIGIEIDDRIADELAGAVVGHIAAASCLEHFDAELGEPLWRRHDIAAAVFLHTNGDDVRVLEEKQRVGNALGLAILDQNTLQLERVRVRHDTEPSDLERSHRVITRSIRRIPRFPF